MKSIDYKNPIFVNYINVDNIPRSRGEEIINASIEYFEQYNNITMWTVAVNNQPSKIECIYDGTLKNDNVIKLIDELTNMMDEFENIDDLKKFIRNLKIDNIIK